MDDRAELPHRAQAPWRPGPVSDRSGNSDLPASSRRALSVAIGTSGGESMRLTVRTAAAVAALAVGMPSLAFAQNQQQGQNQQQAQNQQQGQGQQQGQMSAAQVSLMAMASNAANWVMQNGD